MRWLDLFARLKPGESLSRAQLERRAYHAILVNELAEMRDPRTMSATASASSTTAPRCARRAGIASCARNGKTLRVLIACGWSADRLRNVAG